MSRYIDADKLLELYDYQELNEMINAYARKGVDKKKWNIPIGVVKQNIKDMPTADVVEVVRCKDCRNWENGRCYLLRDTTIEVRDNDFCSYGERAEE